MATLLEMNTDGPSYFDYCMRAPTVGERLEWLSTALPNAPAGLLREFAEKKVHPIFAGNAIVGHTSAEGDVWFEGALDSQGLLREDVMRGGAA